MEAAEGIDQPPTDMIGDAEVDVGRHVVRLERERPLVGLDGLVDAPEILEGDPEVAVDVRDVRRERERLPVARHRLLEPSLGVLHAAQIAVRVGEPRIAREGGLEVRLRLAQPALRLQHDAQVVARLGIGRVEHERPSQRHLRLAHPPGGLEHPAEVAVELGGLAVDGDRAGDQLGGNLMLSPLMHEHAEPVQRVGIPGVEREHFPVERFGIPEPAGVVVSHRGGVQRSGAASRHRPAFAGELRLHLRLLAALVPVHSSTAQDSEVANGKRRRRRVRSPTVSMAASVSPGKRSMFSSSKATTAPRGIRGRRSSSVTRVGSYRSASRWRSETTRCGCSSR